MAMMKIVSAKVPTEWAGLILQRSRETGQTPSDIIREAIGSYLGQDFPDSRPKSVIVPPDEADLIRKELANLRSRVAALEDFEELNRKLRKEVKPGISKQS